MIDKANTKFLVPVDFTEVARTAIAHAADLAKSIQGELFLLHIVADKDDVEGAKSKLDTEIQWANGKYPSIKMTPIVRVGNIFDDIGDVASENGVSIIIMGTHGASGWQKVTGSFAMKVITNSKVPFIVTQKGTTKESGYDKILVPLDLHNETKQKLEIVADMAKYFQSEVHLVTPKETDEFLRNKLNGNIAWAKKYLAERGIKSTTQIADKSGSFVDQLLAIADEIDADLITIMNLQRNSLMGILGPKYEQEIITNKSQIPVLCVNPKEMSIAGGSVFGNSI
jgi:nucleotide-binding universal stress UspA family protein